MNLSIYNRIDEQGRFLGFKPFIESKAGQYDTHSYSVLKAEECICFPEKPFKALEMLCLAQDYALEQGFILEWMFKQPQENI